MIHHVTDTVEASIKYCKVNLLISAVRKLVFILSRLRHSSLNLFAGGQVRGLVEHLPRSGYSLDIRFHLTFKATCKAPRGLTVWLICNSRGVYPSCCV